jgi:hypothetical protein
LQRLFTNVLSYSAPNLFVSSFNEHIGGRQAPSQHSKTSYNMGLPNDPQSKSVWVDTYAAEFSRDVEPSVEMGDRVFTVLAACVHLYKAGETCATPGNSDNACCTTEDKEIWNNVWSVQRKSATNTTGAAAPARPAGNGNAKVGAGMTELAAKFQWADASAAASASAEDAAITCPPGTQLDVVQAPGDNGSCDCAVFCASDWDFTLKAARPQWRGSTTALPGSKKNCQCIQATHWCTQAVSCQKSCAAAGVPTPFGYCIPITITVDHIVTSSVAEKNALSALKEWSESCAGTAGSSVFCSGDVDGREGPMMVYNTASAVPGAIPLYRCCSTGPTAAAAPAAAATEGAVAPFSDCKSHFLSISASCEKMGHQEEHVGWMSPTRGGETLRALRRCRVEGVAGAFTHAVDLPCLYSTGDDLLLGFVR